VVKKKEKNLLLLIEPLLHLLMPLTPAVGAITHANGAGR
jgi:hypothetical protein